MKYSGHKKLLCKLLKLSKLNAFILLRYQTNTDASILVYKFRSERTGFNMYAEYTQLQLTFLPLVPCFCKGSCRTDFQKTRTGCAGTVHIHTIQSAKWDGTPIEKFLFLVLGDKLVNYNIYSRVRTPVIIERYISIYTTALIANLRENTFFFVF